MAAPHYLGVRRPGRPGKQGSGAILCLSVRIRSQIVYFITTHAALQPRSATIIADLRFGIRDASSAKPRAAREIALEIPGQIAYTGLEINIVGGKGGRGFLSAEYGGLWKRY